MTGGSESFAEVWRSQVDGRGELIARELCDLADAVAAAHFAPLGLRLPRVVVLVMECASARTLADHIVRDVHGIEYRIRVAPSFLGAIDVNGRRALKDGAAPADVATWRRRLLADVLLHELVHVAQGEDREPGYKGHGPKFAHTANAVGAALGLPQVGARPRTKVPGRTPLPDCAQWPLNVRPAGYYGGLEACAQRGSSARKRAARGNEAPPVQDGDQEQADQEHDQEREPSACELVRELRETVQRVDEAQRALVASVVRETQHRAARPPVVFGSAELDTWERELAHLRTVASALAALLPGGET